MVCHAGIIVNVLLVKSLRLHVTLHGKPDMGWYRRGARKLA